MRDQSQTPPILTYLADALDAAELEEGSRELSLAKTKIQEAMFWANQATGNAKPVKGI